MNNNPIISVTNLSKAYAMQTKTSLRTITSTLFSKGGNRNGRSKSFYALRGISFDIHKGEGVALFGRNGSGKTTLLQLLANVMSPTSGSIEIKGRYTALLGANLGLMPTMTGLENIHLMAAMYGFRLDQEPELLEEIIAFADIGEFIDSYVKSYSSGMKARIGFSVAIHVLPEIIFIDEVLAVGDVHFKKKCSDVIMQLRADGRTFIIVAHNIGSVKGLCERAIWLDKGEIKLDGKLQETWDDYFSFKRAIRKRKVPK